VKKLAFAAFVLASVGATPVGAQDVAMLVVPNAHYTLGAFGYDPPLLEGWRAVGGGPTSLNLVYAERINDEQINSRLHVQVETFPIPDPKMVTDGASLADLGRRQQIKARGDAVVAFSDVTRVPGKNEIYQYEIVSKVGEAKLHEVFFTTLAPDRSAYAVAMAATQEEDYASQPYWSQFYGSLASFKPVAAEETAKDAGDAKQQATGAARAVGDQKGDHGGDAKADHGGDDGSKSGP